MPKKYSKIFDRNCSPWTNDQDYNIMVIKCMERHVNDKLRILGWISLNEVYDLLGFPRELEAQNVGWKISDIYDRNQYAKFEIYMETDSIIRIVFLNVVKLL